MVKIRSIDVIADKWEARATIAGPDYEAGVRSPKEDWATEAAAAEPAYEAGVSAAIAKKLFSKGVKAAGTAKWQSRAIAKGVGRYPEGVRVAKPDYSSGFGPYRDEIERITLPARGPRGDPKNIERVKRIADALFKKRVGGSPSK